MSAIQDRTAYEAQRFNLIKSPVETGWRAKVRPAIPDYWLKFISGGILPLGKRS